MILYSPGGVPTSVPRPLVKDYLNRGYSKKYVPPRPAQDIVVEEELDTLPFVDLSPDKEREVKKVYKVDQLTEYEFIPLTEKVMRVLNYLDKEALLELKYVGEAVSKKIIDGRPFIYEEEFKQAVDTPSWKKILQHIEATEEKE